MVIPLLEEDWEVVLEGAAPPGWSGLAPCGRDGRPLTVSPRKRGIAWLGSTVMIQEEAENQREEVIKEACFRLLGEALFLTAIKYLSRKETQKSPFRDAPNTRVGLG